MRPNTLPDLLRPPLSLARSLAALTVALLPAAAALPAQAPAVPPAPVPGLAGPEAAADSLPRAAAEAMAGIGAADLQRWADWLASDERGGRLTASPGQEATARYLAEHFEQIGLEPLGEKAEGQRSFFQRYGVTRTFVGEGTELRVGELSATDGFAILGATPGDLEVAGELRYVGRGRTRGTSAEVEDDADLSGVIPVVVVRPPQGRIGRPIPIEQKFMMSMGTLQTLGRTARNLEERGARAVLFAMAEDPLGLLDVLNYVALVPGKDLLTPRFPGADEGMAGMARLLGAGKAVSLVLSPALTEKLCGPLGLDPAALRGYVRGEAGPPATEEHPAGKLVLRVARDDEATACNVVALLRGSDPELAGEAVVFSAHMDHVGRRMDGDVYNGADDNASGTAGLMGIAAAFARAGTAPRRSVVFLAVSGEEMGLWGSAYFAEHPTFEGTIVANVNTDMIGRSGPESGPDEVTVTPSHDHRMFSTMVQDAARHAESFGMTFTSGDKYYERSDHYNFARRGIPVVFFCNGEHEDYHQVTDHADKLDSRKMQRIAQLAFWTGWAVADADEPPRRLGPRSDWK